MSQSEVHDLAAMVGEEISADGKETENRFLVYRVNGELYGSPLLSIREVIKIPDIRHVPQMKPYFKGVVNLRGQVLGVMDLRLWLDTKLNSKGPDYIIVFECQGNPLGAIVDDVVFVTSFEEGDVEKGIKMKGNWSEEFFIGVAKKDPHLIHLVDVSKCLDHEDMTKIRKLA